MIKKKMNPKLYIFFIITLAGVFFCYAFLVEVYLKDFVHARLNNFLFEDFLLTLGAGLFGLIIFSILAVLIKLTERIFPNFKAFVAKKDKP